MRKLTNSIARFASDGHESSTLYEMSWTIGVFQQQLLPLPRSDTTSDWLSIQHDTKEDRWNFATANDTDSRTTAAS